MRKIIDPFIGALIGVIALAFILSHFGVQISQDILNNFGRVGIAGIFFFYGLKLDNTEIKKGLSNWRVHVLTQSTSFLLFPLIVLVGYPVFFGTPYFMLWMGVFFLACLPSTVSSSVVMVAIAQGNLASAIFNASISGLIGVVMTPFLIGIVSSASGMDVDFLFVLKGLSIQVLAPVGLGLLFRPLWHSFAIKQKAFISTFDKSIILLIVFKSFLHSFGQNVFDEVPLHALIILGIATVVLFFAVFFTVKFFCSLLKLAYEDETVALFCGSKKSLIHGTVFLTLLFGEDAGAALLLVPVMFYHAFQLVVVSYIAQERAKKKPRKGL